MIWVSPGARGGQRTKVICCSLAKYTQKTFNSGAGYVNSDLIGFSVLWPSAAITAWVGQLIIDSGGDTIKTLWQMAINISDADEPTGLGASVYADVFAR